MRVLMVIQRYGGGVIGGAERSAAELSTRLVHRGHDVEVLTSNAGTYGDWAPGFPVGSTVEDGVAVHRLPVETRLDRARFDPLNQRVIGAALQGRHVPMMAQREWLHALGPVMPGLHDWLTEHVGRFDAVCVHTVGYWHAASAIEAIAGRCPVVLHPLAHEEPGLVLPVFDAPLLRADVFAFLTPEEQRLIERRAGRPGSGVVIGLGAEPAVRASPVEVASIRKRLGVAPGDGFLLCAGRVDRDKGVHALAAGWEAARRRGADLPVLVVSGEVVHPLASSDRVRVTGPLSADELRAAMAASTALVNPSVFESFGIVLTEAWAQGTPALVNARCDVLAGQCRRSGGGLSWHDLAELHEQIHALEQNPELRAAIGERGASFVRDELKWDDVLDRYEALLSSLLAEHRGSPSR
jgi:glycosyltransferase involved in cell wall biosynthesis